MSSPQYPFGHLRIRRRKYRSTQEAPNWLPALACVILLAVVVGLVLTQSRLEQDGVQDPAFENETSVTSVVTNGGPNPPATATSFNVPRDHALAELRIAERKNVTGYSRDMFPTWLDFDNNGCRARDDILAAQAQAPVTKRGVCAIADGTWVSVYDGATLKGPQQVEIDHVIPLANAWRSGANEWTAERRAQFANDTSQYGELIVSSSAANRAKADSSPDVWRPSNRASWCGYGQLWLNLKVKWSLNATTAERNALGQMLETCN